MLSPSLCLAPVCNDTDIRLVNGSISTSGTLEVCIGGRLGYICSNSWDSSDAAVACRQLGYPTTGVYPVIISNLRPHVGTSMYWMLQFSLLATCMAPT